MKLSLILLLIFGLAFSINVRGSPVKSKRSLHDDLDDFLALVPKDRVVDIFFDYLENDEEVQATLLYLSGAEFHELVKVIEEMDYVRTLLKYLDESGLDVYRILNVLHQFIGMDPFQSFRSNKSALRRTGGMAGLLTDIFDTLPVDEIRKLYHHKLESSVEFRTLVERLQSDEFQTVINALFSNEEFKHILAKVSEAGVDVDTILRILSLIFNLEFPVYRHVQVRASRTLNDDLVDFLVLLPLEEITEVVNRYIQYDEEVKSVIEYIQSVKFREFVTLVEKIEDVIRFYDYLHESGLNVYDLVNQLHDFMGLPPLSPPTTLLSLKSASTNGVAGLIAEVKALLPLEEIKVMYYNKLKTSVEFKQLVERLQSPKFQAIIDTLIVNEEFQAILAEAKSFGLDVKAVANLLSTVFGLEFPKNRHLLVRSARALHDDLDDFIGLLPLEEITIVVSRYLQNDEEVKSVIEYIQSDEFREFVKLVEAIEDVIRFYDYLHESGLDVYDLVNKLHDFIGLPPLIPPTKSLSLKSVPTYGVSGLIAEIKALLPLEDIKVMYYNKLETSAEFKQLVERLQSPKFQVIIDTLIANEEFQAMLAAAKNFGVDVRAVAELLSTIFGLEFPSSHLTRRSQSIHEHLEDFLLLLPFDKIAIISFRYIYFDPEVLQAVKFIKSQEFKNLVFEVQQDPDVQELANYVEDSGGDLQTVFDLVNDFLGISLNSKHHTTLLSTKKGGVQAMLNEIREVIPYDEIRALYEEKIQTSEEFRYFTERLEAPEFQAIIDKLVVNENLIELGHQAEAHGININHITKFLSDLFGLKFPNSSQYPSNFFNKRVVKNLSDDLDDFFDLIPVEDIISTTVEYVLHDEEVQHAVIYLRSEEYKTLDRALHEIPEYKEILDELAAVGLNVDKWVSEVHGFLGIDNSHLHYRNKYGRINKSGIAGFIESIKLLLPYEKINDLYHEKIETSEDFKIFVQVIKSEKFQTLTNKLFENKEFQRLLHQAQEHGINLMAISDFFLRVFGITTPSGVIGLM
ncbi:uncharacterized protein LOC130672630 [Microplitis mediator]|uniref:uncharacterized protein LOC130672630 n=1 Tax=Microplitis mediator TaxID=375433 RepID=UPI002557B1E5|nr:uncharacterized protein LOC130672630 [Microplitis mediator]